MKRQRGNTRKGVAARAITKKKAKRAGMKTKEVAERKAAAEEGIPTTEEMAAEWGSLWSGVFDEEISWAAAAAWIPFWEMEPPGDAHDALYGDVLWDYDIWDLKAVVNVPNP